MKPANVLACVGAGVALSLLGCWGLIAWLPPAAAGSVAVIDLNVVAQQLGRDEQIAGALKTTDASLAGQLANYQSQLQQQLAEKKSRSEDAKANGIELANFERALNQQYGKARLTAQQSLANQRRQLLLDFRNEVTPVATEVARKRGLSVVVVKSDALLAHESQIDISNAVVQRMKSAAGSEQ